MKQKKLFEKSIDVMFGNRKYERDFAKFYKKKEENRRKTQNQNPLCELLDSQRKIWEKIPLKSIVLCGMLEQTGVLEIIRVASSAPKGKGYGEEGIFNGIKKTN